MLKKILACFYSLINELDAKGLGSIEFRQSENNGSFSIRLSWFDGFHSELIIPLHAIQDSRNMTRRISIFMAQSVFEREKTKHN